MLVVQEILVVQEELAEVVLDVLKTLMEMQLQEQLILEEVEVVVIITKTVLQQVVKE